MSQAITAPGSTGAPASHAAPAPLSGPMLIIAALMLAAANFIAVLNMTIANVAVPNIAGALGAAASQGTWVITSFAVGEAITVPLTGWFAARFGAVRVFVVSMVLFGIFSILCGLSTSIGMLVVMRVFQGLAGGPLMPLSQTLMLRIFPKDKAGAAIGIWSMTTLVNAPIAIGFGLAVWKILQHYQDSPVRNPFDKVGLLLLLVWVVALQLVLDEGKNLDWFASRQIVALTIITVVGFAAFLIWELHEKHPVVDLRVFRHRGFNAAVITVSVAYAAFFGVSVLTPLWLQSFMGYTATDAGLATAWTGVTALFVAPIVANSKRDPRALVFFGVMWMALVTLWRTVANSDMAFWDIAIPLAVMGFALPFFFIPTTGIALGSVDEREMDSAAGLMNFLRTLSGAFATSVVTTVWANQTTRNHAELVGLADRDGSVAQMLAQSGAPPEVATQVVDYLIVSQSGMLSTNQVMTGVAVMFFIAAAIIWIAPKPTRVIEPGAGGH